ncbi:unnamed protein product [Somion occarium]|uniref:CNH domain-containing protein n=1 Tax=Somion occarium TaxID=3059160 RepID=A0ABP1CWD9_9APHY
MTSAPTRPVDVPPYQLQPLISNVLDEAIRISGANVEIRCAQALGSEIYVGCSNGELLRFALQGGPSSPASYTLLSRQTLPNDKPIDEIVLTPSISRALILSDHQIHFYTLPALDPVGPQIIKPIRNVITFAVDEQHLLRPPLSANDPQQKVEPVEFCVIKRTTIALYSLRERLFFQKEIPLPNGGMLARRTGKYLCVADRENYNIINLESAEMLPLLPLSQAFDSPAIVKPLITVISDTEFLILSWTGTASLGLFITGEGEPVRGTLEWPSHPESLALDYPYITTLLPNRTIEIHNIENQSIVQVVSAPSTAEDRRKLVCSPSGFLVPSSQGSTKLQRVSVPLRREGRTGPNIEPNAGASNSPEPSEPTHLDIEA